MSILDKLLQSAKDDTRLLKANDQKGDDFSIPRDVVFILFAKDTKKADAVATFINENKYGFASISIVDDRFRILVLVNMPTTQNLLVSMSGLMNCVAELFGVEYASWNCVLQCPLES